MGVSGRFQISGALFIGFAIGGLAMGGSPALADALSDANALVIADPANIDLSLDYALIAEGRGEYRLALSAYERVLINDPGNADAKRGLVRVRRILQPPSTHTFLEAGTKWESNVEHVADGEDYDFLGYGRIQVKDERRVGDTRWRTVGSAYGEVHSDFDSLNYANISGTIGPIVDLGASMISMYPAIGGGAAVLHDDFYYVDVNASATFEGYLEGAHQWARVRAGYRQYEESLTADSGFYADASARLAKSGVIVENDQVSISPSIRWSGIDGTFNDGVEDYSPGKYLFGGVRLAYFVALNELLTVGGSLSVDDRYFFDDTAPNGDERQDVTVKPGVTVMFNDIFGVQTGLRFNYTYEYNDSNDPDHDYDNHILGMAITARR